MSAQIIDGKKIAADHRKAVSDAIAARRDDGRRRPGLAVILVGDNPASQVYVRKKIEACENVGMVSKVVYPEPTISQKSLLSLVDDFNNDDTIDGIIVQLPLPAHLDSETVIERVCPDKDVDGFHPYNMGRLAQKNPWIHACTPLGIIRLLETIEEPFYGRRAVVVGASNIVGRPMALELLGRNATVTVCHRFTDDLADEVGQADILVVAVGKPDLIKGAWIRKGTTVIDVGMNRLDSGKLVGDVEFNAAAERAAWITPVPGGVGPMTVAMLMRNTLQIAEWHDPR